MNPEVQSDTVWARGCVRNLCLVVPCVRVLCMRGGHTCLSRHRFARMARLLGHVLVPAQVQQVGSVAAVSLVWLLAYIAVPCTMRKSCDM